MSKLIQHHEKYLEIHGEDKIVLMDKIEHMKLHQRLRKEGKCNIPKDELAKISHKARTRTKSGQKYKKEYQSSERYLNWKKQYRQTEKGKNSTKKQNQSKRHKEAYKRYKSRAIFIFWFSESIDTNLVLYEQWVYNKLTNQFYVISGFKENHRNKRYFSQSFNESMRL